MHDSMTIAFEIKNPFKTKSVLFPNGRRRAIITIWHVDPQRDGLNDTCDWSQQRHWWQHPQWHVHHWRIQIHAWKTLKRWAFDRCSTCHKPFKWGEVTIGSADNSSIWHTGCYQERYIHALK